jgi:hypothetical protein
MMIDDQRRKDTPAAQGFLKDPWSDWKPAWSGKNVSAKNLTVHDVQERHSPTERAAIRLSAEKQLHHAQRRITDGRLWDAMSGVQQDAAIEITIAYEMMGRGMGYVLSNWQRIPGCRGATHVSEAHSRLIRDYMAWAQKCAAQKISHAMVIDALYFGFSCRMIDHDRRQQNGAARTNLMNGLSLYAALQGWE